MAKKKIKPIVEEVTSEPTESDKELRLRLLRENPRLKLPE